MTETIESLGKRSRAFLEQPHTLDVSGVMRLVADMRKGLSMAASIGSPDATPSIPAEDEMRLREILAEEYANVWPMRADEVETIRLGDHSMFSIPYRVAMAGDDLHWPIQAEGIGLIIAEDAHPKPDNIPYLAVKIAEACETGNYPYERNNKPVAPTVPAPAGWVMVPVEPTPDMLRAAYFHANEFDSFHTQKPLHEAWPAMLSARPTAAEGGENTLYHAFRNADEKDWEHLFLMLPDSGHGQFWKTVLFEVKTALASTQPDSAGV